MRIQVAFSLLLPVILVMPAAYAADDGLFQWKNVNIQGMGYVTGLTAAAYPGIGSDVYIRTDVGGAYRYQRNQGVSRSAQSAREHSGALRPASGQGPSGDRWIPLLESFNSTQGLGVESIAVEAATPGRVYVAVEWPTTTNSGGNGYLQYNYAGEVLVSDNYGGSWQPTGLAGQGVVVGPNGNYRVETGERLAADPNAAGLLYFATRAKGVWKGVRNAAGAQPFYSWTQVQGGLPDPASLNEPSAGGAGDQPGFTFVLFDKSTLAHDPRSGPPYTLTIYVGAHSSGVWRSTDGGVSWILLSGGPTDPVRGAVAADGTLYVSCGTAGVSGTVWKYSKNAWTNITPAPQTSPYTGITSDPTSANIVMVGNGGTVWRSTSGGSSWTAQQMLMQGDDPLTPGTNPSAPLYYINATAGCNGGMAALMIDPANPKQVWWTNGWGVARTDDVTAATPYWAWHMQNLEELVAVGVKVPPKPKSAGGADLLTMVMDMIGFRIPDRDQVPATKISPAGVPLDPYSDFWWQPGMFGGNTYPVPWPHTSMGNNLDYCYTQPDHMAYVGWGEWQAWPNYGSSNDNGQTWTAFAAVPSEPLWSGGTQQTSTPIAGQIAMSATNPQNMVWVPAWGTFDGGFDTAPAANAPWPHYTTDGGKTWQLCLLANPPAKPSPYDPQNNDQVHYNALPKTWTNAPSPYVVNNILAADRADPQGKSFYYLYSADYTSTSHTVFYTSTDGGATWRAGATDVFPGGLVQPAVVANPLTQGELWVTFARNGGEVTTHPLYRSQDGGMTFHTVASVDSAQYVGFGAGTAPHVPFVYLYGRVGGATVDTMYKSEDLGVSWTAINNPSLLGLSGVSWVEGDMRTPNLVYVARGGRGVMYGVLPPGTKRPAPEADAASPAASGARRKQ